MPQREAKFMSVTGFSKVMVCLDGSPASEVALPAALRLVARGGTLILFRVTDLLPPNYLPEGTDKESLWASQLGPVEKYLDTVKAGIECENLTVATQIGTGATHEVIVDYASREAVEAIVMSTHARTGLKQLWLGSVATDVVKASPIPVMLVHPLCGEGNSAPLP
jgi:nucleotide-binding universal stress UspA family protein